MVVYELTDHDDLREFYPTKREAFAAAKVYFGDDGSPAPYEISEVEIGAITSRRDACNLLNRERSSRSEKIVYSTFAADAPRAEV